MAEAVFISPGAIRGYHIYSTNLEAESREVLNMSQERGNIHDHFTVAVKKDMLTVGHLLIEISKLLFFYSTRRHHNLQSDKTS